MRSNFGNFGTYSKSIRLQYCTLLLGFQSNKLRKKKTRIVTHFIHSTLSILPWRKSIERYATIPSTSRALRAESRTLNQENWCRVTSSATWRTWRMIWTNLPFNCMQTMWTTFQTRRSPGCKIDCNRRSHSARRSLSSSSVRHRSALNKLRQAIADAKHSKAKVLVYCGRVSVMVLNWSHKRTVAIECFLRLKVHHNWA